MFLSLDAEPVKQTLSSQQNSGLLHGNQSTQSISPDRHIKGERGKLLNLNEASETQDFSPGYKAASVQSLNQGLNF
jgi:hypothetical protein